MRTVLIAAVAVARRTISVDVAAATRDAVALGVAAVFRRTVTVDVATRLLAFAAFEQAFLSTGRAVATFAAATATAAPATSSATPATRALALGATLAVHGTCFAFGARNRCG